MAKRQVALLFKLRCPEKQKDGLPFEKERMGTAIDVLAAKVPQVQTHWLCEALQIHLCFAELDTMSGRQGRVIA
jgi:hypothetical protein